MNRNRNIHVTNVPSVAAADVGAKVGYDITHREPQVVTGVVTKEAEPNETNNYLVSKIANGPVKAAIAAD